MTSLRPDGPPEQVRAERHAVVIGAGIAGLLVARVLTQSHERVTVLDRDSLPAVPQPRRGVPQSRHLHLLLARGREIFDELFPGFTADLVAAGAPAGDLQTDLYLYDRGRRLHPAVSGLTILGVSRPRIEDAMRDRVAALPGLTIAARHEAVGLVTAADRISGVLVSANGGPATPVAADLVVDAAGRGSRSPVWLKELGYDEAPEDRIGLGITYVTGYFPRTPSTLDGRLGLGQGAHPGEPRGLTVLAQEGDRLGIGLQGTFGEVPPTDGAGIAGWLDGLAQPELATLVRDTPPLDTPAMMRFPASVRRRYERLRRFPEGLLVVGDALCTFNPVYAQGMTVAALEALLVRDLLAAGTEQLAARFFRGAARVVDVAWSIAAGADLRFPQVQGRRGAGGRLINAYLSRFLAAAVTDPALCTTFLRVTNLLDPPSRLLAPATALRVLRPHRVPQPR